MILESINLIQSQEALRTYVLPTQEALKQHIKFSTHQSICWMKAPVRELPDPANWGWKRSYSYWLGIVM